MEAIKPSWIKHCDDKKKRQCIFSTSIDRENLRLATGGMDGVIKIWKMSSLFESNPSDALLASMARHNGSVLCVRWSAHGLLASSSDDTIILLWQRDFRPASLRGNLENFMEDGECVESYRVVKRLIGHQSDAVGVEWSPDGRVVASCSLDGTICLWNAEPNSSQSLLARLDHAHNGFIKGLAWDPTGKFLASQSDDGSAIVWNISSVLSNPSNPNPIDCADEGEVECFREAILSDMFVNMSKMTFFHRPSWSPDGTILALSNAANQHIPVAALIERANWYGTVTSFVGHLGPIEVVSFCPKLFHRRHAEDAIVPETNKNEYNRREMICAVAGQDGHISVWCSSGAEPLLALRNVFEHTVMDLAWSPDGQVLTAASYDGTSLAVKFDYKEFGLAPLSDREQTDLLGTQLAGNDGLALSNQSGSYLEHAALIEHRVRNQHEADSESIGSLSVSIPTSMAIDPTPTPDAIQSASIASLTAIKPTVPVPATVTMLNGKKRITPQLIAADSQSASGPATQSSAQSQNISNLPSEGRLWSSGVRLRDDDFIIHGKMLGRAGSLLNGSATSSVEVFTCSDDIPSKLSVSLISNSMFSCSVEVVNSTESVGVKKANASLQLIQNGQCEWKERLRGNVYLLSGNMNCIVCATKLPGGNRHVLLVFSPSGRRIMPILGLNSRVAALSVTPDQQIGIITVHGELIVWSLGESKMILSNSSIISMLPSTLEHRMKIVDFSLLPTPCITATSETKSTQKLFFHPAVGVWTKDSSSGDGPLNLKNEESYMFDDESSKGRLERIEKFRSLLLKNPQEATDKLISELEFELALIFANLKNRTVGFGSEEEAHFERYLAMYAVKLSKECKIAKARELLGELAVLNMHHLIESLLIPIFCDGNISSNWQDFVASILPRSEPL